MASNKKPRQGPGGYVLQGPRGNIPSFAQWGVPSSIEAERDVERRQREAAKMAERLERQKAINEARQKIEEATATIAKTDAILSTSLDATEKENASKEQDEAKIIMRENTITWNRIEHERSPTQFEMDLFGGSSKRRGTKKHQKGRKTRKTRKGKRGRKSKKARRLAKPSKRCKRVSRRR